MLAVLIALLQVAPPAPTVILTEGQPAPRAGFLVDPLRIDEMERELAACERERDGARAAAGLLRGLTARLERSFAGLLTDLRLEMERERAESLARLVKVTQPAPRRWYASPWLWGGGGLVTGALIGWRLAR